MIRRPPRSTLFPYTTLFRSPLRHTGEYAFARGGLDRAANQIVVYAGVREGSDGRPMFEDAGADRKSTRLNSSHLVISYAVFCLKKKKKKKIKEYELNNNKRR